MIMVQVFGVPDYILDWILFTVELLDVFLGVHKYASLAGLRGRNWIQISGSEKKN